MVLATILPAAGMNFFLRGLVIGFSIAAPVGPIGLLCIRRTLAHGRASGLVSGLGAATADAAYGAVAGFGLTAVAGFLTGEQAWLRLLGGAFLLYLGGKTFLSHPGTQAVAAPHLGLAVDYVSTLLLTLTNPTTILSFIAVFAGLGLGGTKGDFRVATQLVAGVFLGSAAWWWLLSSGVGWFREKLGPKQLRWLNWLSGGILFGFGLAALLSLLR
jgi:threonine/homoserine/homoserine lactone efflux protein